MKQHNIPPAEKISPWAQRICRSATLSTILLIGCVGPLLSGCARQEEAKAEPPPRIVRTQTVSPKSSGGWREFPGVIEAAQSAELGFRVAGKITKLYVREGQEVEQGQVLAQLDDTDYKIQLSSRQAEYEQAKADYERAQQLQKQKLIAQADVDKLKAQYTATSAALEAAQQNVQYTTLKAPFSGLIARRHVDNYEEAAASAPIYTLQDLSSLHVKVNIPETVMVYLKRSESPIVSAIFDIRPDEQYPMTIQAIATEADANSHTYAVTLDMPPIDDLNLLPGMSVTVRGGSPADTLITVPPETVLANEDGTYVFVVDDIKGELGTVHKRPVATGEMIDQGVVVTSGLDVGDRLVTAGMSKMYDGLEVRLDGDWSK